MRTTGPRGTAATHRDLARWSRSMRACATSLATRADDVSDPHVGPAPAVTQVRRLLQEVAAEIDRHAAMLRRLDDEIEVLRRRGDQGDARHLAELERRRARSEARLRTVIESGARALIPGGDALDPATILHRLGGSATGDGRTPLGHPTLDRAELRRLLAARLVRGGSPDRAVRPVGGPEVVHLQPRAVRLSLVHRRLARGTRPLTRSGVAS